MRFFEIFTPCYDSGDAGGEAETQPTEIIESPQDPNTAESESLSDIWDKAENDILSLLEGSSTKVEEIPETEPVVEPITEQKEEIKEKVADEVPPTAIPDIFKIGEKTEPITEPVKAEVPGGEKPETNPEDMLSEEQKKEMTKEEIEAFNEKFFENPLEAVTKIAQDMAMEMVKQREVEIKSETQTEIAERQKWDTITKDFISSHEDYPQFKDQMLELIQNPVYGLQGDEKGLEKAYALAKTTALDNVPTVNDMLQDENVMSEIMSNDSVRSKIINEYLATISKGGQPQIITNDGKGETPSTPKAKKPQTLDEAEEMMLKSLG